MFANQHTPLWDDEAAVVVERIYDDAGLLVSSVILMGDYDLENGKSPDSANVIWNGRISVVIGLLNPLSLDQPFQDVKRAKALLASSVPPSQLCGFPFCASLYPGIAVGMGITDVYVVGESAAECYERVKKSNPQIEQTVEMVRNGDVALGVQANFKRTGEVITSDPALPALTPEGMAEHVEECIMSVTMKSQIDAAQHNCAMSVEHECRQPGDAEPVKRGIVDLGIYADLMREAGATSGALSNYQEFLSTQMDQDGRVTNISTVDLEPTCDSDGDIILKWETPTMNAHAIIMGDGYMHLTRVWKSNTDNEAARHQAYRRFDKQRLVDFIASSTKGED